MKPLLPVVAHVVVLAVGVEDKVPFSVPVGDSYAPGVPRTHPLKAVRRYATALLLIYWLATPAGATTFVVRVTPGHAVLGTDSKAGVIKRGKQIGFVTLCKITQINDVFFTAAGVFKDDREKVDLSEIAAEASEAGGSVAEKAIRFGRLATARLARSIAREWLEAPDRFREMQRAGAVNAVFVGSDNGQTTAVLVKLMPYFDRIGFVRLTPSYARVLEGNFRYGTDRANGEADAPGFWDEGSVAGVRKYLEIAIDSNPTVTGRPIHLLYITKTYARWVDGKPEECPEIKPYANPQTARPPPLTKPICSRRPR
jgi:hypothetical protein